MQLLLDAFTLDGGLDWTGSGAVTPVAPQGLEELTPWRTSYKVAVARSKEGITASSSLMCSNTAIDDLTTGSNIPTDSTDLQVTMQHKSGTALIWRDRVRKGKGIASEDLEGVKPPPVRIKTL